MQFEALAEAIGGIADPALRTKAVMDIFGKSGANLLPLMTQGAAGVKALRQEARDLGLQVSGADAAAATLYGDTLANLWSVVKDVAFEIGAALAPALTALIQTMTPIVVGVAEWISQNRELVVWIAGVAAAVGAAGAALVSFGVASLALSAAIGGLISLGGVLAAVFAAIVSPVGLVIAAIVALGAVIATQTEFGVAMVLWLGEQFSALFETVSRTIPLHEFFELPSTGQYRAKVSISYGAARTQFMTPAAFFNMDPGHKLWSTTVGVPEGQENAGTPRLFSVLSLQRKEGMFLYAKLENMSDGSHYPPYFLGRMLAAVPPQMQIDRDNNLYVLHAASDDTYILSQVDVATGRSGQAVYRSKTPRAGRPSLSRQPDGKLAISGGIRVSEEDLRGRSAPERAKLSTRPEGFKLPE
jgi:hypothetical protein